MRFRRLATFVLVLSIVSCKVVRTHLQWEGPVSTPTYMSEGFGKLENLSVKVERNGSDILLHFLGKIILVRDLKDTGGYISYNKARVDFEGGWSLEAYEDGFTFRKPDLETGISKAHHKGMKAVIRLAERGNAIIVEYDPI